MNADFADQNLLDFFATLRLCGKLFLLQSRRDNLLNPRSSAAKSKKLLI